jgi:hypothetical protein
MQLSRDRIGYFESRRPQVVLEAADKPFDFKWPQPDRIRAGGSLLQLRGVGYTYPGASAPVLHVSAAVGNALHIWSTSVCIDANTDSGQLPCSNRTT